MNFENKENLNDSVKSSDIFLKRLAIIIASIVSVVLIILLFISAIHIWLMVFASILVAVMLRGIGKFIMRFLPVDEDNVNEIWKVGAAAALITIVAGVAIFFLGPRLESQFDEFSMRLPDDVRSLESFIRNIPGVPAILDNLPDAETITNRLYSNSSSGFGTNLISEFTGIVSTTIGFVIETLIIVVVGFYLAVSPSLYVDNFVRLFPATHRPRVQEILREITSTLREWMLARGASVIAVIILTIIGLMIIGMPLVLTLAIIAGVLSFIPNLGPIIGAIPAMVIASGISPQMILFVIILYTVIQSIESYFITPVIQQNTISLPPALIIMLQIFAAVFLGFLGVFLAAPLVATIIILVKEIYVEDILGDNL